MVGIAELVSIGCSNLIGLWGGGSGRGICAGDCLGGDGSWLLEERILAKDIGLLMRSGFCR